MKALKLLASVGVALAWGLPSQGSGFALYEPSAVSHALGGTLVGKAVDASANFNNPATLSDLTNVVATVGFVTEHPRCQVRVTENRVGKGDQNMDPGLFWLPHFQLALPLPKGFSFGLGASAEYGLGSEYDDRWAMCWNTRSTLVRGYVLNPNVAYAITDDWSVGVGLRWLYFDFDQESEPQAASGGVGFGSLDHRLKGDNGYKSFGWQVGTRYRVTRDFSVGLVYKSAIDVTVEGHASAEIAGVDYSPAPMLAKANAIPLDLAKTKIAQQVYAAARASNGDAEADLTLPQSIALGCNWDVVRDWHVGFMASWTQWSEFDTLVFDLPTGDKPVYLNWNDTWRAALGLAYDFAEDWTGLLSYTFDMDCCLDKDQTSTMLPPAHRNILGGGLTWRCWKGLELALSYACIFMDGGSMDTKDALGNAYHYETCRGFCHAAGFSVTYRF